MRRALELRPDAVLMVLRMPRLDGLGAIERIRSQAPEMAVIVLTTYDEDELMAKGMKAGARGYLLKDTDRETLFRTVRAAVHGGTLLLPQVVNKLFERAEARDGWTEKALATELSDRETEILQAVARRAQQGDRSPPGDQRAHGQSPPDNHFQLAGRTLAPLRLPRRSGGFDGSHKGRSGMRRIVVSEFVTLDGIMEDPGGSERTRRGGWALQFPRGKEGDRFKEEELYASDILLLGRVTYQGFAAAWPSMTGEFADKMNGMTKVVVSTTLDQTEWNNSRLIQENVPQAVSRLKKEAGGDILVAGSARLVHSLLEHNLVDELRLMVFPILLGEGKRLFHDPGNRYAFRLVEAKPVGPSGVLTLVYHTDSNP